MVKEFRAVLVMVPPLLADLIRHVVASRAEASGFALLIVAEICDPTNIGATLTMPASAIVALNAVDKKFATDISKRTRANVAFFAEYSRWPCTGTPATLK